MSSNFVKYVVNERVATITLNRPEKRNALNAEFVKELKNAFLEAENNSAIKVLILKANGTVFSAGADLEYLQQISNNSLEENLADSKKLLELYQQIYNCPKITIAQVQGDAIAGGCGLVTVCDFSFVVDSALLGYTEVKLGFVPAIVSSFLLQKVGLAKAKELLLTGKLISAKKARKMGLINFTESTEKIDQTVADFTHKICSETSQNSIKITKELLHKIQNLSLTDALNLSYTVNAKTRQHPDFKKGVLSFLDKTPLSWGD